MELNDKNAKDERIGQRQRLPAEGGHITENIKGNMTSQMRN
jgi:hypothetical protein